MPTFWFSYFITGKYGTCNCREWQHHCKQKVTFIFLLILSNWWY